MKKKTSCREIQTKLKMYYMSPDLQSNNISELLSNNVVAYSSLLKPVTMKNTV